MISTNVVIITGNYWGEDDPDATQLPPGPGYEDEYYQPILLISAFITILVLLLVGCTDPVNIWRSLGPKRTYGNYQYHL